MGENKKVSDIKSDSWKIAELGELITSITNGVTYDPESTTGFPITRIETIAEGTINPEKVGLTPYTPSLEKFKLKKGEILYSHINSVAHIGKTAYCENDYEILHGMNLLKIKPKDSIDAKYLYYILNSKFGRRQAYSAAKRAVNQASLSTTEIRKFKFPIPPLPEQKAISHLLTLMDIIIHKNNHLIAKKELQKKWLIQNLLTGNKRLKGFSEDWKEYRLADVTTNFSRRNKELIDAKVYSVTNTNGFVLQSEYFEGKVSGEDLSNYKIIKKHEFAYNPARINVGSLAYFEMEIGVISSLYVCFRTKGEILDYYLHQFLFLDHTKYRIETLGEGGVRIYLWYDLFSKIKINLPPLEEQIAIVEVLQAADKEIQLLKTKDTNLKTQKKGLMQQLLSGKKRLI